MSDEEPFGIFTVHNGHSQPFFISGSIFSLKVHLPERMQKLRVLHFGGKPIEEFNVVSDGSLFCAFAQVEDHPTWTHIGAEYRELVRKQIEKETRYKSPTLGPTPIHPDCYVIFRATADSARDSETKFYSDGRDLFTVLSRDSWEIGKIAESMLIDVKGPLLRFYSAQRTRHSLLLHDTEVSSHFADLAICVRELSLTPWWNVRKANASVRSGRKTLSAIYTRIVAFERLLLEFNRQRTELLDDIRQHHFLSHFAEYFRKMTEADVSIPQGLYLSLNSFAGELQTFRNVRSLIAASFLGLIVGSLLTLTSWLLSHLK